MTSQLASQLQKLQQRANEHKQLSDSFLFSKSDAKSYSREQIHQLATNGISTLISLDNRFHSFLHDLFNPQTLRKERGLMSAEEHVQLNRRLDLFLTLLSPHLFQTCAQQVVEYLVRVFEIHVYNVMAVLRCFVPYHDHNLFARMLLLLDLRDTGLAFLHTNQERGASMPRDQLLIACRESKKVLRLVCDAAAFSFRSQITNHAAFALFVSVACGLCVNSGSSNNHEAQWRVLLPYVMEFMEPQSSTLSQRANITENTNVSRNDMKESQTSLPNDVIEDVETEHKNLSNAFNVNVNQNNLSHLHHSQPVYHREAVSASLLIIASWSTRVVFALPMMSTLLQPLMTMLRTIDFVHSQNYRGNVIPSFTSASSTSIMTTHPVALSELLLIVNLLVQTQVHSSNDVGLTPMLNMMLLLPWQTWCSQLPHELGLRQSHYYDMYSSNGLVNNTSSSPTCHALFSLLLQHCCARITISQSFSSTPPEVVSFLSVASEYLPLSPHLVQMFIRTILSLRVDVNTTETINHDDESKGENGKENDERDDEMGLFVSRVLGNLERRFQILFDRVLSSELLKESTSSRHAKQMVHHFFHGTKYAMVKINESHGTLTFSAQQQQQQQLEGHLSVHNSHMANETTQVVSGSAELPLFACLLHPEPQIRELGAHALTAMTLEELFPINLNGTPLIRDKGNNKFRKGDTQNVNKQHTEQLENSLLGLLMHVSAYETNSSVALAFVNAAAHALQLLTSALSSFTIPKTTTTITTTTTTTTTTTIAASSGTETELQIRNKSKMNANIQWIIGAVHGLLKSMYTMLSMQNNVEDAKHDDDTKNEMENTFFTLCLMPYLQPQCEESKNISHNTTASAHDKTALQKHKMKNETKRKRQNQAHTVHEEENDEVTLHLEKTQEYLPSEIKSVMVYYALLMYMNMHNASSMTSTNMSIITKNIEQSLSDYGVPLHKLIKLIHGKEAKIITGSNNKQDVDIDDHNEEEEGHEDEESVETMQRDKRNSKKKSANWQIEDEPIDLNTFDEIFSHIAPVAQSRLPYLLRAVQDYMNVDADNSNSNDNSKATHNNAVNVVSDATTNTKDANHKKVDLTCKHAVWQECLLCLTVCLSASSSSSSSASLQDDCTLLTLQTAELLTKFLLGPSALSMEMISYTQAKSNVNNKI